MWYGKKPDVSDLRIFSFEPFVHVPDAKRRQLDPKSIKCFFVGFCELQKGYRFWDPVSRTVRISRDATVLSTKTQSKLKNRPLISQSTTRVQLKRQFDDQQELSQRNSGRNWQQDQKSRCPSWNLRTIRRRYVQKKLHSGKKQWLKSTTPWSRIVHGP